MINNIIFFHNHVNGDSIMSRIFVKQIIDFTKNTNINYYYTANRSINSYCKDIGIKNENFNVFYIPHLHNNIYNLINNNLYINVWIGNTKIDCCYCMKNIIKYYNTLISQFNNNFKLNIDLIKEQNPFIIFDYNYYDCLFLKKYVLDKKIKYNKIITIYNVLPQTFIKLQKIDYNFIITNLANKYHDYLFITFNNSDVKLTNVLSFKQIYKECYNIDIYDYSIQFSYLCLYCDNIIGLLSGVCQPLLNDSFSKISKNITIIYESNLKIFIAPLCNMINNYLCTSNITMNCYKYLYNDNLLLTYLELFILNIPYDIKKIYMDQLINNQSIS
jgi:hypothetical protein